MTEARRRRRIWPWLLALTVLWAGAAATIAFLGVADARAGAAELREIRDEFELASLADADADIGVDHALDDFRSSARRLGHPVLAPARLLPVVGRQVRAAEALADSGTVVLDRVIELRAGLADRTTDGLPAGRERVEFLTWLRDELVSTEELVGGLDLGPDDALVGPLDRARRSVDENLTLVHDGLRDARVAADAALAVFGQRSRYLVVAANNAEMRVGSGMFLSLGELRIEGGALSVSDFASVEGLTLDGRVDAPADVEALWGWTNPGREWRNLGLTPDFTVNGAMASQMWAELGREPVDGVLSIDVFALAMLLEVTGPVDGPDGQRIDADNVDDLLLHDQYLELGDRESNEARREQLATVAKAVLSRLDRPGLDLGAFAGALQEAQRGRHLMAWSADPLQQEGWLTLGIDGSIDGDDLLIGVANIDASKMDPFLGVGIDVETAPVDRSGDGSDVDGAEGPQTEYRFTVTVANRTPRGEPLYVLGADPEATYDGIVVAYLPAWMQAIEATGGDIVASGREGDNLVIGLTIAVPRGEQVSVEFVTRGPADRTTVTLEPGARRPAAGWQVDGSEFTDRRRRTLDLHAE